MDASLEAEFEKVRCLFDRISWPLTLSGIWPKNITPLAHLKFIIFITYFGINLFMLLLGLASVMGNLELMVSNLMETAFYLMAMYRILIVRIDKTLRRIIDSLEKDFLNEQIRDSEEIKIILEYSSIVDRFYRTVIPLAAATEVMWYFTPLQTYIITRIMNGTAVLELPYRIYHFIDMSQIEKTAIVYACEFAMVYPAVAYVTCYGISLGFVTSLCGQLAVLTHRILTMKDNNSDPRMVFQQHIEQHMKIVVAIRYLNDIFHLALLYELVATTVLMGLVIYQFLLTINDADAFTTFGLATYIIYLMLLVYVNCFMGECLNAECTALLSAYYECNWYEMSPFYKKALIICMETTQEPIRLTAGKFYVFSLQSFAQIMKSSMVYVSMLRTLI